MQHNHFFATTLIGLCILASIGCGNTDNRYTKVEGTITYKGTPVDGATVTFLPVDESGESASGKTDAGGKFSLTSVQAIEGGRGVLPGEYRVIVSKRESPPSMPEGAVSSSSAPPAPRAKELLPEKYMQPGTSDLQATVNSGKNNPFDFELTD